MRESRGSVTKPYGAMKVKRSLAPLQAGSVVRLWAAAHCRPVSAACDGEAEQERTLWDPKDGELCLSRTKSGETLMEVRSDSDVQIDRQTWV